MIITVKRPKFAEYQRKILESPKRFTVTEACTKAGKTFSHIYWLFEEAHRGKQGHEYWWVAPVYNQAEIAFKRLCRKVSSTQAYTINLSKLTITTPIGTIIAFKSADNPDSLYGENVYAFVFDEYSRAKEEAWFALRTTITYTKAKGKFIGNVVRKNWAYELARKAEAGTDPEFDYFKVTAYQAVEAGILTLAEIEQAKKDLPTRMFNMLYLAEFAEVDGALWSADMIDGNRVFELPDIRRIVIGIDPAVTAKENSDETGIIVCGLGIDGNGYVLDDFSGIYSPANWARIAIEQYYKWNADAIVVEVNNGGDLVRGNIENQDRRIRIIEVRATKGKITRAEPIVALYENGQVKHFKYHSKLESQMLTWNARTDDSPDRVDALVWGFTELILNNKQTLDVFL